MKQNEYGITAKEMDRVFKLVAKVGALSVGQRRYFDHALAAHGGSGYVRSSDEISKKAVELISVYDSVGKDIGGLNPSPHHWVVETICWVLQERDDIPLLSIYLKYIKDKQDG